MSSVLHMKEMVVTGDDLGRVHQSQEELRVDTAAVLTPTAWDYIRDHRLRLTRGESASEPQRVASSTPENAVDEAQMVPHARCDQPGRSCGCATEEFGSGFVQPDSCEGCVIHQLKVAGKPNPGCEGCNLNGHCDSESGYGAATEALVSQITDQIMEQLHH